MKTFFNVLYRRILYKIPLKILLLLFGICAIFFASCNVNAGFMNPYLHSFYFTANESNLNIQNYYTKTALNNKVCVFTAQQYCNYTLNYQNENINLDYGELYCYDYTYPMIVSNNSSYGCEFTIIFNNNDLSNYFEIPFTSSECQQEYSLMPIENCDSNYCENNNLCPVYTGDCENSSGLNWSSLYINNIQHIGGPNIYIDIPEELSRDYDYIDEDIYIDVEGYNVDYDKITGIIDVQNYKPSQEDFNNIIGILADYMPIIVIFLGLLFIYKMIRKPFKSKL